MRNPVSPQTSSTEALSLGNAKPSQAVLAQLAGNVLIVSVDCGAIAAVTALYSVVVVASRVVVVIEVVSRLVGTGSLLFEESVRSLNGTHGRGGKGSSFGDTYTVTVELVTVDVVTRLTISRSPDRVLSPEIV